MEDKVVIGSRNPAKIKAVENAIKALGLHLTVIGKEVESGVSAQPMTDSETLQGAKNRAFNCSTEDETVFAIGLEGGIDIVNEQLIVCNWGALVDKEGNVFLASGARIPLPDHFQAELKGGRELGQIMNDFCNRNDISKKEGAVGIFTNGAINRIEMFEHVCKLLIGQWQFNKTRLSQN
ncbi:MULTISPECIES: DUF84 family protein [Bacillus]|uniref:DUF84 family protein n=1 Tax=Bacillus TaxID=1386 RepID=UPI000BB7D299|nr:MULTISPECIES: DUF84 family protein [Bacillus]